MHHGSASIWNAQSKRDQRRVWLDENDCERMTRTELNALKALLIVVNFAAYANDDLAKRLESIPHGKQRLTMALGGLRAVANDLIGTITSGQAKQIQNTMTDMQVQIVPKLAPNTKNVIFEENVATTLIDCARVKCAECVEDGETCRKCDLYKVLEAYVSLEDYGSGLVCPYAQAEWEKMKK